MEKVTVIIPTYNRPEVLPSTVGWIQKNLICDGEVDILIGDDGDDPGYTSRMSDVLSGIVDVKTLTGPRRGLGANLNMLIGASKSEIVLQMDDDHHLVKPLDINQFVEDLSEQKVTSCAEGPISWIRLFLGTEEDLNNDDPFYRFKAKMCGRYWLPVPEAPELWIASNRPHLKHKDFHRHFGMYSEEMTLGNTEYDFCFKYLSMKRFDLHENIDSPWVAIPVAAPSFDTWAHVGDSWQKQNL